MNFYNFFTFIGFFFFFFFACSFIGLLFVGVIVGIVLLIDFNIYVAAGVIIGIIALGMTIDIMKED